MPFEEGTTIGGTRRRRVARKRTPQERMRDYRARIGAAAALGIRSREMQERLAPLRDEREKGDLLDVPLIGLSLGNLFRGGKDDDSRAGRLLSYDTPDPRDVRYAGFGPVTSDSLVNKWVRGVTMAGVYSPVALGRAAIDVTRDVNDLARVEDGEWTVDRTPFGRTFGIGKSVAAGLKEDVTHPVENLPFLAMDAAAGAGLVIGGSRRVAQAQIRAEQIGRQRAAAVEADRPVPRTRQEVEARIEALDKFLEPRVDQVNRYLRESNPSPTIRGDHRPRRTKQYGLAWQRKDPSYQGEPIDTSAWKPIRSQHGPTETRKRAEELLYRRVSESEHPTLMRVREAFDERDELLRLLNENAEAPIMGTAAPGYGVKPNPLEGTIPSPGRVEAAREIAVALMRTPPPGSRVLTMNKGATIRRDTYGDDPLVTERGEVWQDVHGRQFAGPERKVQGLYARGSLANAIQKFRDRQQAEDPLRPGVTLVALPEWMGPLAGMELRAPARSQQQLAKQFEAEAERLLERLEQTHTPRSPLDDQRPGYLRTIDALNKASVAAILYAKAAYITPNLLGQTALVLFQHHFNPLALWETAKMQRELFGQETAFAGNKIGPAALVRKMGKEGELVEDAARIRSAMGEAMLEALTNEEGYRFRDTKGMGAGRRIPAAVDAIHGGAARFYTSILDTPFREAAWLYEARVAGFDNVTKIRQLLHDPQYAKELTEVSVRANRALIDYGRLNKMERNFLRRVVFFYPWLKGSTMYAAHFAREHPVNMTVQAQLGREEAERADRELGPRPGFLQGVAKVGEQEVPGVGKLPLTIQPAAASILGSPAEVTEAVRGLALGDVSSGGQLSEFFNPLISAGVAVATGVDPFTKQEIDTSRPGVATFLDQMFGGAAPVKLVEALAREEDKEKEKRIFPTVSDKVAAIGKFAFGGLWPRPTNPKNVKAKFRAEQRERLGPVKRVLNDHMLYREETLAESIRVGLLPGGATQLPADLRKALGLRARRYTAQAELKQKLGRDLTAKDRLQADLSVLVKQRLFTPAEARAFQQAMASLNDPQIDGYRTTLGKLLGSVEITLAKQELKAAGGDPDVLP